MVQRCDVPFTSDIIGIWNIMHRIKAWCAISLDNENIFLKAISRCCQIAKISEGKVQITIQILKLGALADQNHLFLGFLSQSDVLERDFYPKTSLFGKGRTEFIWIANLEIILKSGFFKDISRVYFPPAGKLDGDSTEM